jgi:hypothetical protein
MEEEKKDEKNIYTLYFVLLVFEKKKYFTKIYKIPK